MFYLDHVCCFFSCSQLVVRMNFVWTFFVMSGVPSSLWAHPPLPPGKRIFNRSSSEDRRSSAFGFMRKFPSVRRNNKKECMTDTTYESFDSLFEDNDIVLVGTEYADDLGRNKKPFTSMFRSRSDGNLAGSSARRAVSPRESSTEPKGLSKYLKALSGSWKNLLNSKWLIQPNLSWSNINIFLCFERL